MKWRRTQSEHVDDLRGRGSGGFGGIGGRGIAVGGGLGDILDQLPGAVQSPSGRGGLEGAGAPPATEESEFVTFLTEDVQAIWADEFQRAGREYAYARTNMFTGQVQTGCGAATSAVGPFYCPADREVYIDLDFFRELRDRFGAPGDFAQAYVIAHEMGHHVQNLLGISDEVTNEQQSAGSQEEANRWSVKLELQAGMRVDPETWTHGSAEWRQHWFNEGFESGSSDACDTFADGATNVP